MKCRIRRSESEEEMKLEMEERKRKAEQKEEDSQSKASEPKQIKHKYIHPRYKGMELHTSKDSINERVGELMNE
jgi:hypothetical protein